MQDSFTLKGNIVDVLNQKIFPGQITISKGRILEVAELDEKLETFILPGFVDAHIHVESSMLIPSEFARIAVMHGTVATVSDPHEIGNVLGVSGVEYMIENAKKAPLKIFFGAPSCVPATGFETAGAIIGPQDVERLLDKKEIVYLSEVMNFPGVLAGDEHLQKKIKAAKQRNKQVDGHAPGLRGDSLKKYIAAGITTDHESFEYEEGLEKLQLGMKLLIREGSAAKNYEALAPLIKDYWQDIMFCSDDKHPDEFIKGHINELVKRAFKEGYEKLHVLYCACVHPVKHYGLNVGLLQKGDEADFIVVDDLEELSNIKTYIGGKLWAENGKTFIPHVEERLVNNFCASYKTSEDFAVEETPGPIKVIEARDGQLITGSYDFMPKLEGGKVKSSIEEDVLKIAVVNRYGEAPVSCAFIKGFGLKKGAIASSVAHDSHNIVAVGVDDESLCEAVNLIFREKGGVAAVSGLTQKILPLPVAGIMSNAPYDEIAAQYSEVDNMAKEMGSTLKAPFMTLSFMALLVIPELKLSDKGLFDVQKFQLVSGAGNRKMPANPL
jgi:adenine deaminase